jgi:hypothetical protein
MGLKNSNAATEMKARPEPLCSRAHPRAGRPGKMQSRSLTLAPQWRELPQWPQRARFPAGRTAQTKKKAVVPGL